MQVSGCLIACHLFILQYKSNLIEKEDDDLEELNGNSPYGSHVPSSQANLHDSSVDSPESQQPEDRRTGEEAARKLFFFLAGHLRDLQPDRPLLNVSAFSAH